MGCTLKRLTIVILSVTMLFCIFNSLHFDSSYAESGKNKLWSASSFEMYPGEVWTQKLINAKGKTIKATKIKWKSAKPTVARINKKGRIKALKVGTAKMTAKYGGKTYKFKVKVKDPLKGKKPKNFKIKHYKSLQQVGLSWSGSGLDVFSKYQVYVSINGGDYKLYKTTEDWFCDYKNVKEEVEYKFKVRAVLGKCRSLFTDVKTFYYEKENNKSISLENDNIVMKENETQTVNVMTDKGYGLSYTVNNNNVTCKWGDWIPGTTNKPLYITANNEGETIITVYDSNDNTVKATLTVTIEPLINTSVSLDTTNLSLKVDEAKTITVFTDNGGNLICECDNNNVKYSWGKWDSDRKSKQLIITGNNAGNAYITIYDSHDRSVFTKLSVSIASNIEIKLPVLPIECGYVYRSNTGKIDITIFTVNYCEISYERRSNGQYKVNIRIKGEKTSDTNTYYIDGRMDGLTRCVMKYIITDLNGNEVSSGYELISLIGYIGEEYDREFSVTLNPGEYILNIAESTNNIVG